MTRFQQQDAANTAALVKAINATVETFCRTNPSTTEQTVHRAMGLAAGEAATTWALGQTTRIPSQSPADQRAHVGAV